MIAIKRTNDDPYQCEYINVPLNKVANGIKRVPDIYINKKGNNINSTFISYCLPLIQGEITIPIKNGIYHFVDSICNGGGKYYHSINTNCTTLEDAVAFISQ